MSDTILAYAQPDNRFGTALKSLAARFAKRWAYQRALTELDALSDRELADIGLARGTIREVAYQSIYGAQDG